MHLTVLGFIRTPSPSGQASVVTLITHIGRVILSGSELSYVDDTQAELFYNAGFPTSSSGSRRLLQVQTLFGLFNAVSSLSNTTTYAVPSPSLPDSFVMFARRRTPCIPHPVNGTDQPGPVPANFTGGAIPIVPGLDVCALLNINTSLLVVAADSTRYVWMTYTLYRHSATQLRVEYTHPFVPGTMLVEVLDNSNSSDPVQFSYQVNSADRGLGLVTSDTVAAVLSMNVSGDDIPMLVGPVSHFTQVNVTQTDLVGQMLGASMDYMGDTTIAGEPVRIWAVHLNNDTFTAFWYDSVADEQARRIAFGDFGELDVLRLVPLPGDAPSNSYLYNPPTEGITVMLDAQENMATTDAVTLPTKLSLDPFAPYAAAFKLEALNLSAAAPSPPSQATRRRLQQASLVPPAFLGAHRSVLLRPNYGNSTGRHLLQSVGACAASNVCPVTVNLLCGSSCSPSSYNNQAITQPFGPVTFVVGPVNAVPCLYQFSAGIPIDPPVLSIGGTLAVQLCANQQGFSYASGTLGLSIGLPIDGAVASTATSPFTWNIVSITVGLYNNPVPETCSNNQPSSAGISTSGASSRALAHLSSLYGNNDARSSCGCLQSIIASTMAGFTINGPDIPGIVLSPLIAPIPGLDVLIPQLYAIKFTPSITYYWSPYICGMTRSELDLAITASLNLVFFTDSVTLWNPGWVYYDGLYPHTGHVGDYTANLGTSQFGAMVDAYTRALAVKLQNNLISWQSIVNLGGTYANAARSFLEHEAANGISSATSFLRSIFKPVTVDICTSYYAVDPHQCVSWFPSVQICSPSLSGGGCSTTGGACHTTCKPWCKTHCDPIVTRCSPIVTNWNCYWTDSTCTIWAPIESRCGSTSSVCVANCY